MNRLESMSLLIATVDAGSLSGAARSLGMPLATLSRKVGELEAHLKTRLLHRTTRQLSLTEAGHAYVAACRRILEDIEEAGEYLAPKGELIITTPVAFGRMHVLPVVTEFLALYPEIDIRLVLADRVVHLMEEHVDVAVRIGELPDSTLVATKVGNIHRIICGSKDYLDRYGIPTHPRELIHHQCISFDALSTGQSWVFQSGKSPLSIPIHARLTVNTAEAAIAAASLGIGLTNVLSYQAAEALHHGSLHTVLDTFSPTAWPISLVHTGQSPLPLKLRVFLDFMTPRLRERMTLSQTQSSP